MKRPNIILITTDQQRWDTLGVYGNPVIHTPNMDRLAREGVVFQQAITPCPLCLPARSCLMTGLPASRLGTLENCAPREVDNRATIAGILGKNGYFSQAIGKMHFSNTPYAESYGMDNMVLSEETRGFRLASEPSGIVLDDYDRFLIDRHLWGWDKPPEIGYNEIKPLVNYLPREAHVTQWCGDVTVDWLHRHRPLDRPFFLWSSFVKPHVPYDCPQHLAGMYGEMILPEPWVSDTDGTIGNPLFDNYRIGKEFNLYSKEANQQARANYYANITFIDEQVGRILKAVEEEDLADSTLVIFTSDHGDLMGDHGLWYKNFGYEGSLHIPLLMRWPMELVPGTRCDEMVSLLDILPTVLAATRIESPVPDRPGKNLLEMARGKTQCSGVFSEILFPPNYMCHFRTKEWKYLFYQNGGYEQLFHLTDDPHELVDLARDPSFSNQLADMRRQSEQWIARYGDGRYSLDTQGRLRSEPYGQTHESCHRPFSRMPWDSRIPPVVLPENVRGPVWRGQVSDWSFLIPEI